MKINKSKLVRGTSYFVSLIVMSLFFMEFAEAGVKIGEIGKNVGVASQGLADGVKKGGLLVGIALVIGGIIGVANAKKQQQTLGGPITIMAAGIVLFSLFSFMDSASSTLFGSDDTSNSIKALNIAN